MKYKEVRGAKRIVKSSSYLISKPYELKNKWRNEFNNNNPICLELGMGRGEFIINMAKQNPRINYIGLELNESQTATAVSKIGTQNIPNLRLICADAKDIDKMFGREIDTIYLTFSEPWPKPIDEKKRFTHINYLKLYDRIFKKDKHIVLKTDNKVLFAYSLETLSQYWYEFKRVSMDLHNDERKIENIVTDFEKQYIKEHRQIYYVDAVYKN